MWRHILSKLRVWHLLSRALSLALKQLPNNRYCFPLLPPGWIVQSIAEQRGLIQNVEIFCGTRGELPIPKNLNFINQNLLISKLNWTEELSHQLLPPANQNDVCCRFPMVNTWCITGKVTNWLAPLVRMCACCVSVFFFS